MNCSAPAFAHGQRPQRPQKSASASLASDFRLSSVRAGAGISGNLINIDRCPCRAKYIRIGPTKVRRHFSALRYSGRVQRNAKNNSCIAQYSFRPCKVNARSIFDYSEWNIRSFLNHLWKASGSLGSAVPCAVQYRFHTHFSSLGISPPCEARGRRVPHPEPAIARASLSSGGRA